MAFPTVVLLAALCSLAIVVSGTTVQTSYGPVSGVASQQGTESFLGIPFAAPPRRWAPPTPPTPWTDVLSATTQPPSCMQNAATRLSQPSEDCLYLNVVAPAKALGSNSSLPVLVFIHGGSFFMGGVSSVVQAGDALAAAGAVVVSIQYRLGVFGFGGSHLLRSLDPQGSTGNYAILDQRLALQWVRDNAAAFGGNASSVLLFGESAGAACVAFHLVAPKSVGLFSAVAMQSGPIAPWTAHSMTFAETVFATFLNFSGCAAAADQLACAQALSSDQALLAQNLAMEAIGPLNLPYKPAVDGVELSNHPMALAAAGAFPRKVPVIVGTMENEGGEFNGYPSDISFAGFQYAVALQYGNIAAPYITQAYPMTEYPSPYDAISAVIADATFVCPSRLTARWATAAGLPVYAYHFTHDPVTPLFSDCLGACHADDLAFIFQFTPLLNARELELSQSMIKYWTSFAATGVPQPQGALNSGGAGSWPRYGPQDVYLRLDQVPNRVAIRDVRKAQCDLWDLFLVPAPPTPSRSATKSLTASRTPSPASASRSASRSPTSSLTPSKSRTASRTGSRSVTASRTTSKAASVLRSGSKSVTASRSSSKAVVLPTPVSRLRRN